MAALRTSAKMQPPSAGRQAFDAPRAARLCRGIYAIPVSHIGVTISLLPLNKLDVIDTDSVPEDSEFIRFQPSRNEKRQLSFNSGC